MSAVVWKFWRALMKLKHQLPLAKGLLLPGALNVGNYMIIYRIEGTEDALILHVFDGHQDIQARL